jgi:hypothetical protein
MVNMVDPKIKKTRTKKKLVEEKKEDPIKDVGAAFESLDIKADPQAGEEQIDGVVGLAVEPLSEEPSDGVEGLADPLTLKSGGEGAEPPKMPKKRGRKPKGGKIVPNNFLLETNKGHEPNIIMHLKCGESDLTQNSFISYEPNMPLVETFQFENNKANELGYSIIDYGIKESIQKNEIIDNNILMNESSVTDLNTIKGVSNDNDETRNLWNKLKELTYQLHTNSISDKKSACFWCTCDFDNPMILIPKYELNKTYHCYGCFCSPECATAYLFEEAVDTSTRFERYHLLNHIYCKIYNYDKNIKPAPNPYYTLNKYYGNLSIQEYRKLLKNERLLLIVDKPLSRVLPELHEDNDDYMFNGATISTSNKFKLRKKTKQTKTDILSETFNLKGGAPLQPPC